MLQETEMLFDPHTGRSDPYPSLPSRWRSNRGGSAQAKWLYNPWTGVERSWEEKHKDPYGAFIVPGAK